MSLRELLWKLQEAKGFEKPKILLEQYNTSAELASNMMFLIDSEYDEIEDRVVADFGCGTGILAISAALLGAEHVVGFDIDSDALKIAQENNEHFETGVDFVHTNLEHIELYTKDGEYPFDVIVMNPPFGTKKNVGIDARFVQTALQYAPIVYSLHKTSTRKFFIKKAAEWDCDIDVVAELKFDLPKTYKFHKQRSVDIAVDLYRFARK